LFFFGCGGSGDISNRLIVLPGIKLDEIISGLVALRKEFKGKIWLEVMLVSGVNDICAILRN